MLVLFRRSLEALLGVLAALCALTVFGHVDALRAAGVTGKAPPNAAAIEKFVSTLADNALWIIGTVSTLGILIVGALFFFGHSRAADYAIKIGLGALIIVSAPGLAG